MSEGLTATAYWMYSITLALVSLTLSQAPRQEDCSVLGSLEAQLSSLHASSFFLGRPSSVAVQVSLFLPPRTIHFIHLMVRVR